MFQKRVLLPAQDLGLINMCAAAFSQYMSCSYAVAHDEDSKCVAFGVERAKHSEAGRQETNAAIREAEEKLVARDSDPIAQPHLFTQTSWVPL